MLHTHTTISMYTTTITNTTNYTNTTMCNNKFINNHCSRYRFAKLRSRCKLSDATSGNAKIKKKDAKLIRDFYSAIRIEDRNSALSAIASDDGFLKRNSDAYFGESDRSFRFYPITFSSSFSSLPVLP